MLYIKFTIQNQEKYHDFKKLYEHMVMTRQLGFEFEEDEPPEIDWTVSQEELDRVMPILDTFNDKTDEERRYERVIQDYANEFLEQYRMHDENIAGAYGFDCMRIFNYLEFSFEVDMNNLEKLKEDVGLVEFTALGFPYGGIERFLMVLRAFELIPVECYSGFTVYEFDWTSEFSHKAIELPEKTKLYKEGVEVHKQIS